MRVFLFYTVLIGFLCGVAARSFLQVGLPEISFLLLLSLMLGMVWRRGSKTSTPPYFLAVSIFLFVLALGMLRFEVASWSVIDSWHEDRIGTELTFEGRIVREPDERENSTHLYVRHGDELLLVLTGTYSDYQYGDSVHIEGLLTKPERFLTDLGRTFLYPEYLHARGVSYVVRYAEVVVLESGGGNVLFQKLLTMKHAFMRSVESVLPEPHVGLSEGLLLGVKRALGEDLEEVFRTTGIIHIVVLSGYNIMLVVVFVTFILGVLLPERWQLPFGLFSIVAFALMVGLSATVVRASIMASLYLIARTLNRTYMVMRALLLAGVCMVLINPYLLLFDVGFQLSFTATLGLILLAPHIERFVAFVPKLLGREILVATLSTQIFVMPILLYQMGEFSVVSVLVNVLVLPMVPVAMLLTFLTGVVYLVVPTLGSLLALPTYLSLEYILRIATAFAAVPFASYSIPAFSFWVVPVLYMLLGFLVWKLNTRGSEVDEIDSLKNWVIEEEDEARKRLAAESHSDSAANMPIFFKR